MSVAPVLIYDRIIANRRNTLLLILVVAARRHPRFAGGFWLWAPDFRPEA
jgi:hypothetical protein